ncbi:acyl-CoA carboxylase epsilon subunit [Streptomyces sp. NPDC059740]|uniref:acyl-CoA carboxylase epsilon subunit n=1 Tax=Streptomyces sp. NPDC059740 TaxID=3346926 RepID=UPI0036616053
MEATDLVVLRGAPTPEELAALTAVLLAGARGRPEQASGPRPRRAGCPLPLWRRRSPDRSPGPRSWHQPPR